MYKALSKVVISKNGLLALTLLVIAAVSLFIILNDPNRYKYKPGKSSKIDSLVSQALDLYKAKKQLHVDFNNGPCLTNDLAEDWVVDLVHSPRQKLDDNPENQCTAFLEGRASHFIELDLNGNTIRVK